MVHPQGRIFSTVTGKTATENTHVPPVPAQIPQCGKYFFEEKKKSLNSFRKQEDHQWTEYEQNCCNTGRNGTDYRINKTGGKHRPKHIRGGCSTDGASS